MPGNHCSRSRRPDGRRLPTCAACSGSYARTRRRLTPRRNREPCARAGATPACAAVNARPQLRGQSAAETITVVPQAPPPRCAPRAARRRSRDQGLGRALVRPQGRLHRRFAALDVAVAPAPSAPLRGTGLRLRRAGRLGLRRSDARRRDDCVPRASPRLLGRGRTTTSGRRRSRALRSASPASRSSPG